MNEKILLVEDDEIVTEALTYNLVWNGYQVKSVADGASALEAIKQDQPDLLILDIALPQMDGLQVCRELRRACATSILPIIMLTARGDEIDKEIGLDAGADDYITKPYERRELLARVRALLRRTKAARKVVSPDNTEHSLSVHPSSELLIAEPLRIDLNGRHVFCREKKLELTFRQFELLIYMVRNRGIVLTRDRLLEYVWGYDYSGDPRTLDVHIHWLREYIEEDAKNPVYIRTVRGVGYIYR